MSTALVLSGGGPLAVAWECGLIAGLIRAGAAPTAVDLILGTSAGAIVGALLAAGHDPQALADAILAERNGVPPPGAMPQYPVAALMKLPELFALSQSGAAGRREVGSYALTAAPIETEAAYVDRMRLSIGRDAWPAQSLGIVAVDVENGSPLVLKRESGASIAAAVAASCSLPGLSPPVSICGRRYMDGGLRSTANADLVAVAAAILVVCFHPPGPPGERIKARTGAQAEALRKAGARVSIIHPDETTLAAIGPRPMDVTRRPDVAQAGLAQGAAATAALASLLEGGADHLTS